MTGGREGEWGGNQEGGKEETEGGKKRWTGGRDSTKNNIKTNQKGIAEGYEVISQEN